MSQNFHTSKPDSNIENSAWNTHDDLATYETLIDLDRGFLTSFWLKIGLESSNVKTEYWQSDVNEDPKSNVLDLSKEPTEIVLRPSRLEELGEHGKG